MSAAPGNPQNPRTRKVLFIVESAALAHVSRSALFAQHLKNLGEQVFFACDRYFDYALDGSSFKRIHIQTRSPQSLYETLSKGGCLFDQELLGGYITQELEIIDSIKPDLIVGDMRPSLSVSAPISKIPLMTITNACWSPYAKNRKLPFPCVGLPERLRLTPRATDLSLKFLGLLYRALLPLTLHHQGKGLNQLRKKYGLQQFSNYFEGFTFGDRVLYCDIPELVPTIGLPNNHSYLGVASWAPKKAGSDWKASRIPAKKLIYLSLGSSGPVKALPTILKTLAKLDLQIIATTAGHRISEKLPNNVSLFDFLPGDELCAAANLVICNGGSPGIYQALRSAVPVLSIPDNMDQLLTAEYARRAGIGLTIRADSIRPETLLNACQQMLSDSQFEFRAKQLSKSIHNYDPYSRFVEIIDHLLGSNNSDARMYEMRAM